MVNDHLVMMVPVSTVMTISIMMPVSVMILSVVAAISSVIESRVVKSSAIAVKCTRRARIQPQQGGHQACQAQ